MLQAQRLNVSNILSLGVRYTWTNLSKVRSLDSCIRCLTSQARNREESHEISSLQDRQEQLINILVSKSRSVSSQDSDAFEVPITDTRTQFQAFKQTSMKSKQQPTPAKAENAKADIKLIKEMLQSKRFASCLFKMYPNVTKHLHRAHSHEFARTLGAPFDDSKFADVAEQFATFLSEVRKDELLKLTRKVSRRQIRRMVEKGQSMESVLQSLSVQSPEHDQTAVDDEDDSDSEMIQPAPPPTSYGLNERTTIHTVSSKPLDISANLNQLSQPSVVLQEPFVNPHDIGIDDTIEDEYEQPSSSRSDTSRSDDRSPYGFRNDGKSEAASRLARDHRNRLLEDPALAPFANLRQPHEWYPVARSLNRKIVLHVGPTNSGKTHNAMQALRHARSGVYAGPLRLLSWESYDRLTSEGVVTNLVTGQEKIENAGATHISCTVEMINETQLVDVAVIDEAQLIASEDRGNHWTRAFLGLPAKELHVCGDPSIVTLLTELCAITGETMEVKHYSRLTPLKLSAPLNSDLGKLRRGDAVIAFSRTQLYEIKHEIENRTHLKCCIVYGALPPSLRRQQATLFNDPKSGYDVLVASDAVGMGLNLRIGRVVLNSLAKFDGTALRSLTTRELLQIAGRAGRFGSEFSTGYVTVLHTRDYPLLRKIISEPVDDIESAGLSPSLSQMEQFHRLKPDESLRTLLTYFSQFATVDETYFMTSLQAMSDVAEVLERFTEKQLTLSERFALCLCPVDLDRQSQREAFLRYVNEYVKTRQMTIRSLSSMRSMAVILEGGGISGMEVAELEDLWHQLDLYSWMSRRFGAAVCIDVETAERIRNEVSEVIASMLEASSFQSRGARKLRKQEQRAERAKQKDRRSLRRSANDMSA